MTRLRKATLHHLHAIVIKLLLLLLPRCVCDGFFFAPLDALADTVVGEESEEEDEAADGARDDGNACGFGECVPVLFESVWAVEFFESRGLAPREN